MTLYSQKYQVEKWQKVMITLNAWCKTSASKNATGMIIRNYNIKDHLNFCGITECDIKATLDFKDSKDMFNFQKSHKRFFVFNPALKVILIIRLIELRNGELHLLKNEIEHCIDEVNFICFLLKDVLEDTGVIVTGLVTYSGENSHCQTACKDCDNVIASFEIFTSVEAFKIFWKSFLNKQKMEDLRKSLLTSRKKDDANIFQIVASKILGYLAHFQFIMLKEPILPLKKNNPASNIKQAELLLDCYQMEIAYSGDKRIWLEGDYGTGKTIVALKKLELLLKTLKNKEVIYYVNFSGKGPLDFVIKQKFENNDNVRTMKGEFTLSNIVKNQILPKEKALGTKSINLIVDEYNSESLSTEEASSLGQILTEEEIFKSSTFLIAAQPIKINRFDNFYDSTGVKTNVYRTRTDLDQLIQITGMKVKTLNNVMRTTVEINTLVKITQQFLNNQSNKYQRKESKLSCTPKMKEGVSGNCLSVLKAASSDSSKNATAIPPVLFKELIHRDSLFKNADSKPNLSVSVTSDDSSNLAMSSPLSHSQRIVHYDELFKLMPTEIMENKINCQETVTKYSYKCNSQIGHNISGPLPQLVKLAESADPCEQVALVATVLNEIINCVYTKTAVIHCEPNDLPLWLKSLFQVAHVAMTTDVEKFLKDESENLVLVKNLNFVRGLEFTDVLLILDSNEHHLRHFIPEAIARCMSKLSILIRPSLHTNEKSDTVADLVETWEKYNESYPILRIINIGFCYNPSCIYMKNYQEPYCVDGGSCGVHKNYELYRDLLKEIEGTYIQGIQPDYVKKQEEANAM